MDSCNKIAFEESGSLAKLLRVGKFAPWKHHCSRYWDLGSDVLYRFCETYQLPCDLSSIKEGDGTPTRAEAAFEAQMWLIGRSYAASPERYDYSGKDSKKPKDPDQSEGYESFFRDVTHILFSGKCSFRGKECSDSKAGKEAEDAKEGFDTFCKSYAELLHDNSFDFGEVDGAWSKSNIQLLDDVTHHVIWFASLIRKARHVRDLGKGTAKSETFPLENQWWPLSFSSKFLHFHSPKLFFIYDSISSGNLHVGYTKAETVNLKLNGKSIPEIPGISKILKNSDKEGDESGPQTTKTQEILERAGLKNRNEYKKDKYDVYFEHALKELYVANCLYCSVDKGERDCLEQGQVDGSETEPPCFYYLTRMVDSLVTNADQNKKR